MKLTKPVRWPRRISDARRIQERLRSRVVCQDQLGNIETVAGIDVGFEQNGTIARAAVVVLDFPELTLRDQAVARRRVRFPYVPGYLSFREVPVILAALKKLGTRPGLLLCDGQGLAHPRRFGLACHLGLLLDIPSIGVAKSRLIGTHGAVPEEKGARVPLLDNPSSPSDRDDDSYLLPLSLRERAKGEGDIPLPRAPLPQGEKRASRGALSAQPEIIGAVVRTRTDVRPVYVSVGHRISLATAIEFVLRCTTRYRLPETTRLAHRLASARP